MLPPLTSPLIQAILSTSCWFRLPIQYPVSPLIIPAPENSTSPFASITFCKTKLCFEYINASRFDNVMPFITLLVLKWLWTMSSRRKEGTSSAVVFSVSDARPWLRKMRQLGRISLSRNRKSISRRIFSCCINFSDMTTTLR
ncbi:hypothetical protein D3C75_415950 [compost metagenome]